MKIQRYLNADGTVESLEIDGWRFTVAQLANQDWLRANTARLKAIVTQVRADPQNFTPEDFKYAEQVIAGKFVGLTPEQLHATFQGESMDAKDMTELSDLYATPEYRRASELAKTDRTKLMSDPSRVAERRAWMRAEELESAFKADQPARQDRDARGNVKSPGLLVRGNGKHIFPEVFRIEKLPTHEQAHASRALRKQWLDDPKSAYRDEHHPDHKSAIESMALLYQAETMESGEPVLEE